MESQQLRELILKELPVLMQNDSVLRESVLSISRPYFADKLETENRFDYLIARLERSEEKHLSALQNLELRLQQKIEEDREKWKENQQRWEKHDQQWEENRQCWKENQQRWEKHDQQWEENRQRWEKQDQQWEENQQRWEKQDQQWEENRQCWEKHDQQWATTQKQMSKFDQRLMAMGARWGNDSEKSFRNALAGILKEFPGVQVMHVDEHDDAGVVFGYPEEIELDLIIKDGMLIIGEIKSSVYKSDVYVFARKAQFYEQKQNRQATRKIIISPMLDKYAIPLAKKLGIEVYSFAEDVNL